MADTKRDRETVGWFARDTCRIEDTIDG